MNLHSNLSVEYETQILDGKTGAVISRRPAKRNLLLDSGLDGIATRSYWHAFTHCVLGSGTTPTKRDSGAATVSISGAVATASANFFEAADVGRLLKLDSGQEVYISAYTSETVVSVDGAEDEAASEFTIWYVDELGHQNELIRTNTLGTDSGDVSSNWNGSRVEHKRTFIFPVESTSRTYREIGWSHTWTAGGNLLGRDLIPGGGDSIAAGQQYKVVVRLRIVVSPVTPLVVGDVGNNCDTAGTAIVATVNNAFRAASNAPGFNSTFHVFEPSTSVPEIWLRTAAYTQETATITGSLGMSGNFNERTPSIDSYQSKSFEKIYRTTYPTTQGNGTIHGVGFGRSMNFDLKFDTPLTKDSDHTLTFVFRLSWGRTLIN